MMGGQDVLIKYDELSQVDESLKSIIAELKDVSNREDDLKDAIDRPFGKGDLRDKADEFQSGWDDRRAKLLEDIQKVQQHVDGVLTGFQKWDQQTGNNENKPTSGGKKPQ
jgi:hypothetical protein